MMKTEILLLFKFTDLGDKIASPVYSGEAVHDYFKQSSEISDRLKSCQNPCLQIFFSFDDDFSEIPVGSSYIYGERETFQKNKPDHDDTGAVLEWLISRR